MYAMRAHKKLTETAHFVTVYAKKLNSEKPIVGSES